MVTFCARTDRKISYHARLNEWFLILALISFVLFNQNVRNFDNCVFDVKCNCV